MIRDDAFDVPNGKEHIVEYTVADDKGVTQRHSYQVSRVNGLDGTYSISSNFRLEKFASGQSLDQEPVKTTTFQMTAHGIEGEVIGDRRHDTITTTTVSGDGTVSRTTQVVPVRLDNSEFAGLDTEALVAKMGSIHLGKAKLSK